MPQHRALSGGWSNISLASKSGRVGMPSPGLWVPKSESQGAGVVVGVSSDDLQKDVGRREGGTLTARALVDRC